MQTTVKRILEEDISSQYVLSCALHSDLDATRRLGELKSESVESPPIKISLAIDASKRNALNDRLKTDGLKLQFIYLSHKTRETVTM